MQQYRTFWFLLTMMLLVALTACTNGDDNPVGPSSDNLPSDESVLHFFKQINAVPRPSQHEEAMVSYLAEFAKERGLEYKIDGKILVPLSRKDAFASQWNSFMSDAQQHYAVTDPDLLYAIEVADMPDRCIAEADTRAMIMGLSRAPQGVVEWSTTIDDMFETSNNVGAVSLKDGEFIAEYLVRGFVNEKVNSLANEVIAAYDCANTGFTAVPFGSCPLVRPDQR